MNILLRSPLFGILLLGLFGCATPRYETVIQREGPADAAGRACVQTCERNLEACTQACAERYQACLKQVEPEAEAHYRQTLDRYAAALDTYRRELAFREFDMWTSFYWTRGGHGFFWYDPFPYYGYGYNLPPVPRMPSREEDLSRFREARCGGDCGCQAPYDACFTGCGGRIISERRCVANCSGAR